MSDDSRTLGAYYLRGTRPSTARAHLDVLMSTLMDRTAIGRQVHELRRARGLSLRGAAAATGLSHSYIDQVEKAADNANITLERLEQLAHHLGGRVEIKVLRADDRLDDVASSLEADERDALRTFARALIAGREDPKIAHLLEAAGRMLEPYLPVEAETEASG